MLGLKTGAFALVLLFGVHAHSAGTVDLLTTEQLQAACAALPAPGKSKGAKPGVDEQVTRVLCNDIDGLKQLLTWFDKAHTGALQDFSSNPERSYRVLKREIAVVSRHLAQTTKLLRAIPRQKTGVRIRPGEWAIDLNSDGTIQPWERHLFAIPKQHTEMGPSMPSNDPDYYTQTTVNPIIRIDAADLDWSLAYHQFARGLLEFILAYDLKGNRLVLSNAAHAKVALSLLQGGTRSSLALRKEALAEKDDDEEWLPNPHQANHSFPLPMDEPTFATWKELLDGMQQLLAGRTLAGVPTDSPDASRVSGLCEAGRGLDMQRFFTQPPAEISLNWRSLQQYCTKPNARQPLSPLWKLMDRTRSPSGNEWGFLRRIYWVN